MPIPEACLFDLDGVLIDTEPLHGKAWSDTAAVFGTRLSENQLFLLRGRRRADCASQIEKWIGAPIGTQKLLSIQQPISKKLLKEAKAMPGAQKIVEWCFNQKLPMALVTSSAYESVAFKSAPHCWLDLIQTRVLGDDPSLSKGKPAPDPYLLAAKKLKVNPRDCWAIEDSSSGTNSALEAGCLVWVLNKKKSTKTSSLGSKRPNPFYISSLEIILEKLKDDF